MISLDILQTLQKSDREFLRNLILSDPEKADQVLSHLVVTGTTTETVGLSRTDIERYRTPLDPDQFTEYVSSERQFVFYEKLHTVEVFFGGAVGGGKSDAILKAALQFVHVPGYRAIVLRRVEDDLTYLRDRLFLWLSKTEATWNSKEQRWLWPNGASLALGGCRFENTKYKYQGQEYQYIGFDEVTQFTQSQYDFIRTRLRHQECVEHKGGDFVLNCGLCRVAYVNSLIPLRIRGASNPDGVGRLWVKRRFISEQAEQDIEQGEHKSSYMKGTSCFVPSRVEDNPGIDARKYYETSLAHLSPGMRAQLVRGSWRVVEGAILKQEWYRYYLLQGSLLIRLDQHGNMRGRIDSRECRRFATVDTASTSTEEMKRKKAGKEPSWSVFSAWDYWTEERCLFLRHVWRDRVDWIDLKSRIAEQAVEWCGRCPVVIENANCGKQLASELQSSGFQVELFNPAQKGWSGQRGTPGKLDRSTVFQSMLEDGRVFLPQYSAWLADLEGEWVAWTGDEDDPADQVDTASMAAIYTDGQSWTMPQDVTDAYRTVQSITAGRVLSWHP